MLCHRLWRGPHAEILEMRINAQGRTPATARILIKDPPTRPAAATAKVFPREQDLKRTITFFTDPIAPINPSRARVAVYTVLLRSGVSRRSRRPQTARFWASPLMPLGSDAGRLRGQRRHALLDAVRSCLASRDDPLPSWYDPYRDTYARWENG